MTLQAEKRESRGSLSSRKLRRNGVVPGVIYGHGEETVPLTVQGEGIDLVLRHAIRVLDLHLENKSEKCLIRDLQWDALGKEVLHVDFMRVSADERIQVTIPIEVRGEAPGLREGGMLEQTLHELEVECLAISVPDSVRVSVKDLQLDQAIHVKELDLPDGVTALDDADAVVVHIKKPVEEETQEEAEGTAEPELIGKKPEEGGQAEEK